MPDDKPWFPRIELPDYSRMFGALEQQQEETDRLLDEFAEERAREKQEISLREDRLLALAEVAHQRETARVKRERIILTVTVVTLLVAIATLIVTVALA